MTSVASMRKDSAETESTYTKSSFDWSTSMATSRVERLFIGRISVCEYRRVYSQIENMGVGCLSFWPPAIGLELYRGRRTNRIRRALRRESRNTVEMWSSVSHTTQTSSSMLREQFVCAARITAANSSSGFSGVRHDAATRHGDNS